MVGLPCECRGAQTRHARNAGVEELRQIALRTGRTRPLQRHSQHHLAHRWTVFGAMADACPVDVTYQVQLLGHPEQCTHITNRACADSVRLAQRNIWRRLGWTQHRLPRHRTSARGIPY
jgi:hypothetical protein